MMAVLLSSRNMVASYILTAKPLWRGRYHLIVFNVFNWH
jgi:hypothetical protein